LFQKGVKSDKGIDPRKDGSLRGDQPQGAWSETLGHRAKGKRFSERGPGVEVRERRLREGEAIAGPGRPLEGSNPRRVSAAVFGLTSGIVRTDLLEGINPLKAAEGEGVRVNGSLLWEAWRTEPEVTSRGERASRGVPDSSKGKTLKGQTPGVLAA
jgi:hypothetical protein